MKITSKGQVTIPASVRKSAGLLPDTEVEFILDRGKVVLRKLVARRERGRRIVRVMSGKATRKMTTAQIMRLTRGE